MYRRHHIGKELFGTRACRPFGQLGHAENDPRIFIGQKSGGAHVEQSVTSPQRGAENQHGEDPFAGQTGAPGHVARTHLVEQAIEPSQRTVLFGFGHMQNRGTQGRAQGQRVDRGEQDGRGNRHRKLLVDLAGNPGHETDRHEDGQEYEGGGNHGPAHLLHGLDRGSLVLEPFMFHDVQHAFDHNDRIIHHQANGQDQSEQSQGIDAVAEHGQHHEGGTERHRNGNGGNQGRTPVLQEHITHNHHQQEGQPQGHHDLPDTGAHKFGGIVGQHSFQALRIVLRKLFQGGLDGGHGIQCVGARRTAHPNGHTTPAIILGREQIVVCALLDPGHIPQIDHRTLAAGAHHNLAKIFRIVQAALGGERIGHLRRPIIRRRAHRPDGGLNILLLDGIHHLIRTHAQGGQTIGIHPDPHTVFRTVHLRPTDARYALQDRLNDSVRVVTKEELIPTVVGGTHYQEAKHVR